MGLEPLKALLVVERLDVEPYNEEERGRFTAGEDHHHDKDGDGKKKGDSDDGYIMTIRSTRATTCSPDEE